MYWIIFNFEWCYALEYLLCKAYKVPRQMSWWWQDSWHHSTSFHTSLNIQQSVIPPGQIRKSCKELDVCALGKGRAFFHFRKVHIKKTDCETWIKSTWGFFCLVDWLFKSCDSVFPFSHVFYVLVREVSYSLLAYEGLFGLPPWSHPGLFMSLHLQACVCA